MWPGKKLTCKESALGKAGPPLLSILGFLVPALDAYSVNLGRQKTVNTKLSNLHSPGIPEAIKVRDDTLQGETGSVRGQRVPEH